MSIAFICVCVLNEYLIIVTHLIGFSLKIIRNFVAILCNYCTVVTTTVVVIQQDALTLTLSLHQFIRHPCLMSINKDEISLRIRINTT